MAAMLQLLTTRGGIIREVKRSVASIRSSKGYVDTSTLGDADSITARTYTSSVGDVEFTFDNGKSCPVCQPLPTPSAQRLLSTMCLSVEIS